jgi:hypothetical protein
VTSTTSPTERVGRYQLLDPIGVGPSGSVSRAKVFGVAGFERQFAVKRFHAELTATAAMAAMLSAAARAYGSLEHPRIARMSEFGVAQGSTFTAVEYVQGIDALRLISEARLAGASLAAGGTLALVSQAARAIGYAHGRGLTHLGLAPTNVIVTAEGDIKITDFGILSATLPPRPVETSRLAQRIPYLAPEQLANEATSAATDVFALGVLAYELITGGRAFRGDTPQQIAAAIMAGPPAEPALPRPIVRVLQRCLARSPFERFPDARALADALDAALRVAPVPGTRKDIGAQVKETLDRLAALNEGQLSGVVALHLGTGPVRRPDEDARRATPASGREAEARYTPGGPVTVAGGPVTVGGPSPMSGGATTAFGPSPMSGGATTQHDLPRYPLSTVPGLPPPPIPVPAGVAPPSAPPGSAAAPGASTLLGMGKSAQVSGIPPIKPRAASVSGIPGSRPPAVPDGGLRPPSRPGTDLSIPLEPASLRAPVAPSGDDAIHTIDPSDVVSVDSGLVNVVELDALADDPSAEIHPPGMASPRSSHPPELPTVNTKPTQPITPLALEPLLFDPIARRSEPRIQAVGEDDEDGGDEDRTFTPRDRRRGSTSSESRTTPAGGVSTGSGQTITGFAAPMHLPRPATPAPQAQVPPAAADREPPDEDEFERGDFDAEPDEDAAASPPARRRGAAEAHPEEAPSPEHASGPGSQPTPMPPGWVTTPPPPADTEAPEAARPRRRAMWIAVGVLAVAITSVGAWQAYLRFGAPPRTPATGSDRTATLPADAQIASPPADVAQVAIAPTADAARVAVAPTADAARVAVAPTADAAQVAVAPTADAPTADAAQVAVAPAADAAQPDAARVAATPPDAGTPPGDARSAPLDAGQVAAIKPVAPVAPGDTLTIASTPPGARVFLDGSDTGATPLKLAGSPDRHTIALLLAGHELYVAQVDGRGTFQIPLKEVTPTNGPAGIKVLKCKQDRYYVFIDGKPTGQTCPTERIGCEVGPHTVEVYDVVSETRRKWDIVVKDTRLSFRVRVE